MVHPKSGHDKKSGSDTPAQTKVVFFNKVDMVEDNEFRISGISTGDFKFCANGGRAQQRGAQAIFAGVKAAVRRPVAVALHALQQDKKQTVSNEAPAASSSTEKQQEAP